MVAQDVRQGEQGTAVKEILVGGADTLLLWLRVIISWGDYVTWREASAHALKRASSRTWRPFFIFDRHQTACRQAPFAGVSIISRRPIIT